MFNSKPKTASASFSTNNNTMIGCGSVVNGDIESLGDIRIDGILKGNLIGKAKIIIGAEGVVEGDISGRQADIMGRVKGKIKIQELLYLHGNAKVTGDIFTGKLQVDPTAVFSGKCHMGANVVELIKPVASVVNQ